VTRYDEAELYSGLAALMWAAYDEPGCGTMISTRG
jgi:hypothetical protein